MSLIRATVAFLYHKPIFDIWGTEKAVKSLNLSGGNNTLLIETNKKDIYDIFIFFCISRFLFFGLIFLISSVFEFQYVNGTVFLQYDGDHYYSIATMGYTSNYQYAFFPLFPLIIRFFDLFGIAIPGTILFNNILTLFIAYLLYYIGLAVMGKSATESLTISRLWIFSPISIATCVLYTEAIFVFLTVLTYYLYKSNRFVRAGITLGLSITVRSLGSALFFSIFIIMVFRLFQDRSWKGATNLLKLFVPATIISIIYPMYLYVKLGNWHYFLDVQFLYWGRIHTNIFEVIFRDITNINEMYMLFIFTYSAFTICIYVLYNAIKTKEDTVLIICFVLSILMIFSTSRAIEAVGSTSMYRYLFGCASVYLLCNKNLRLIPITIITTILSIYAMINYCIGGFLI